MKILERVHRKIQIVKGMIGAKDFSETIEIVLDEYIERQNKKVK